MNDRSADLETVVVALKPCRKGASAPKFSARRERSVWGISRRASKNCRAADPAGA
jgi:hypothetical protein